MKLWTSHSLHRRVAQAAMRISESCMHRADGACALTQGDILAVATADGLVHLMRMNGNAIVRA